MKQKDLDGVLPYVPVLLQQYQVIQPWYETEIMFRVDDLLMHESNEDIELEHLRQRLRRMSDVEVLLFGETCAQKWALKKTSGESADRVLKVQIEETRAEWKRRHPTT